MDHYVYLFSGSVAFLIVGHFISFFLLKRSIDKEKEKLKTITDSLFEQSKFFEKIKILEQKKDIAGSLRDLQTFDDLRKEQKRLDAEFRRKLKNTNDSTKQI